MLRKILSLVTAWVMVILGIPISSNIAKFEDRINVDETIAWYEEVTSVVAEREVEGSKIRCEYIRDTNEYFLYRDDLKYPLEVEEGDTYVLVDFHNSDITLNEGVVYGQNPVALAATYFTPEAIEAAKAVICSILLYTAGKTTYFSINIIANTIRDVKDGSLSEARLRTQDGITNYWELKQTGKTRKNNYYAAMIKDNKVFIGQLLTFGVAKSRLQMGRDVFATNAAAANYLAVIASPARTAISHPAHVAEEGYYPHFHPIAIAWYKNSRHNPHVWYPYL